MALTPPHSSFGDSRGAGHGNKGTAESMIAVVLAAGQGRWLFPYTKDKPKALLTVGGKTLLERIATQLLGLGVKELIVVAGYQYEKVAAVAKKIQRTNPIRVRVLLNDRFQVTNTLYSLNLVAAHVRNHSLLVIDGDVICEDRVLHQVIGTPGEALLAIDSKRVMGPEEMKVSCGPEHTVTGIGRSIAASAEFLGISKFSHGAVSKLFKTCHKLLSQDNFAEYYERAFTCLINSGVKFHSADVASQKWVEIDFLTDYEDALHQFGSRDEQKQFRLGRQRRQQYLFAPGPVLVSDQVKQALSAGEIGHRELEFSELLNRVRMKLARVYGVENFHSYATVIITGSGSAANEAVLGCAAAGKKLLIVANGEFGERWLEMADFLGLEFLPLKLRWGQSFPLDRIEELIRREEIDAVGMIHHETSTGMLNPLEGVSSLTRRYKKELFVDAVSSIGAVPINAEANGISFCTGSANKAIASVPGLSFVCGTRTAFNSLKDVRPRSMYLDLYKHFVYNDQHYQTPNTPAVNLFFALEAAVDGILDRGLDKTFEKYRSLAHQLRQGMSKLGYRFLIPEDQMSPVLTNVELPSGFGADEFHERLKELGYITYAGKGILRDRIFQVANIGELSSREVRSFLKALTKVTT